MAIDANKDILVVKADFNCDEEVHDLSKFFHDKFGEDAEIMFIKADNSEESEVYLAGRRDNVVVEFEKLREDAVIPSYSKDGDVSMNLFCVDVEYNAETDQYIYHTGLQLKNKPNGIYAYIKPSNSLSDCYLSDYLGFGESDYNGEILLFFKNRTSFKVRKMLEEWNAMTDIVKDFEIDRSKPIGETIDKMKNKKPEGVKKLNPLDYKPYPSGEEIAEIIFVNAPFVKTMEAK